MASNVGPTAHDLGQRRFSPDRFSSQDVAVGDAGVFTNGVLSTLSRSGAATKFCAKKGQCFDHALHLLARSERVWVGVRAPDFYLRLKPSEVARIGHSHCPCVTGLDLSWCIAGATQREAI